MDVYNDIKKCFIDREFISSRILLKFIKQKIHEYSLEDYIDTVKISNNCESSFNTEKNYLNLNPNEILYESKNKKIPNIMDIINKKEKKTGIINNPNCVNIYNLYASRHELEHVIQQKIAYNVFFKTDENNHFNTWKLLLIIKDLITSYYDNIYFKDYFYNKYHDYLFLEYSSNIESYLETIYLVNSFNISDVKDILVLFNNIVAKNLIYLYRDIENNKKLSTPSKNALKLNKHLLKLLKESNIKITTTNLSIYKGIDTPKYQLDRLRLGLSINSTTYNYINKVAASKTKTLNLFDDIRSF